MAVVWMPENPASVILRFDDKNTSVRNQYVINLSSPILHLKSHIVQQHMRSLKLSGNNVGD